MPGNFDLSRIFSRAPASTAMGQPAPGAATRQPDPHGMDVNNRGAGAGSPDGVTDLPGGGSAVDGGGPEKLDGKGSPLDAFKDLFTIPKDAAPTTDPFADPIFKVDPVKTKEAVGKMNFLAGLDPALVQKATSGDHQAFGAILNSVAQNVMSQTFTMFTGMSEQAFKQNNSRWDKAFGDRMKTHMLTYQKATNPALNHPAAAPVLEALRSTIANNPANSGKSPDEISSMAEEYFMAMGEALAAGKKPAGDPNSSGSGPKDMDWSSFLA